VKGNRFLANRTGLLEEKFLKTGYFWRKPQKNWIFEEQNRCCWLPAV